MCSIIGLHVGYCFLSNCEIFIAIRINLGSEPLVLNLRFHTSSTNSFVAILGFIWVWYLMRGVHWLSWCALLEGSWVLDFTRSSLSPPNCITRCRFCGLGFTAAAVPWGWLRLPLKSSEGFCQQSSKVVDWGLLLSTVLPFKSLYMDHMFSPWILGSSGPDLISCLLINMS